MSNSPRDSEKARNLALITGAQVLALSLWFAGTAAGPAMARAGAVLSPGFQAWLTSAVQAGFVVGTLISALLTLPDRIDPRRLFAAAAVLGAAANGAVLLLPLGSDAVIVARFLTGMTLAGVYPVGMKLAVNWADRGDAGFVVGLLVGGLTVGSALPHLANAMGGLNWQLTLGASSLAALVAACLIRPTRLGPRHMTGSAFDPSAIVQLIRNRGVRLAILGYLGHMWELYAMWAWIGLYLAASFAAWSRNAWSQPALVGVATFAVIVAGAIGCVAAGLLADRFGRVRITVVAMGVSAACCLLAGMLFGAHPLVTMIFGSIWGIAVVADSAQFSASVAEFADAGTTGTMLTMQTCLGFALTLVSIQLMPVWVNGSGWGSAFAILAIGPILGIGAMLRLGHVVRPRQISR